MHINTLEGCAVWLAWKHAVAFLGDVDKHILVYCDNATAVGVFGKLYSRSPALNSLARHLAWHTVELDCTLRVIHTPGVLNTMADALSRRNFALARQLEPSMVIQEADNTLLAPFAKAWQASKPWTPELP